MASRVDVANAAAHLASAKATIETIQDDRERAGQRANLVVDSARVRRNEMWPGLDALTKARAEIGGFYTRPALPTRSLRRAIQITGAFFGFTLTVVVLCVIWLLN